MKNPMKTLTSAVERYFLERADQRLLKIYAAAKEGRGVSKQLQLDPESMQAQTLEEWKMAIASATDPENPDRSALDKLYRNLRLDNHLESVIDSRILYCQRSAFKIVDESGNEVEDVSWLLERTWFEEFIRLALMSRFEGTKLVELFEMNPETKELAYIDEIPMTHFNAKKGIITKAAGDTKGWPYKEGSLQPYYIQVGKDNELGMLAQLAPIVLAKKLGMGSWLDYLEKYGVPALFITTDREDDAYLDRLYEAGKNFKSNGFMVGRGNDKFETSETNAGNADNFDKLVERANSEMAKRILGGSGLTDEKSFVGSSEIQFRLANDRFESDKLLLKNIINQQLFPKLAKISPVYAPLVGKYFEWDNTETQTAKEAAELATMLAANYDLDPEEVSQRTGFTILGQRSAPSAMPNPEEQEAIKKKSAAVK